MARCLLVLALAPVLLAAACVSPDPPPPPPPHPVTPNGAVWQAYTPSGQPMYYHKTTR